MEVGTISKQALLDGVRTTAEAVKQNTTLPSHVRSTLLDLLEEDRDRFTRSEGETVPEMRGHFQRRQAKAEGVAQTLALIALGGFFVGVVGGAASGSLGTFLTGMGTFLLGATGTTAFQSSADNTARLEEKLSNWEAMLASREGIAGEASAA